MMKHTRWAMSSLRLLFLRYWISALGAIVALTLLAHLSRGISPGRIEFLSQASWSESVHSLSVERARRKSLREINNATLGFQRILALNLPERTDHRDGLVLAGIVSNITFDFVDGVKGDEVPAKALPPYPDQVLTSPGAIGAWRAHMNAISQIAASGWGSALITEDDIDWDIRIRSQLQSIALGTDFVLEHWATPIASLASEAAHSHVPSHSPYGYDWDVLWLGHCGMELDDSSTVMVFDNDASVPESKEIISWNGEEAKYLSHFPQHSRIVTTQKGGTSSLAYAVSRHGARKLLFELGVRKIDAAFDLMLRDFCQGQNGRAPQRCLSVLPPLFDHFRAAGRTVDSDVGGANSGDVQSREKAHSYNIRWSTRLNMEKLLDGRTDYDDQYPGS